LLWYHGDGERHTDYESVYNKWYMDDGGIIGDVGLLTKVWDLIKSRGPELGLHLNPSKCEWSWLDPACTLPCPIRLDGVPEVDQVTDSSLKDSNAWCATGR